MIIHRWLEKILYQEVTLIYFKNYFKEEMKKGKKQGEE